MTRPEFNSPRDLDVTGLPEPSTIHSVAQPIVRLDDRVIIGYEALARVSSTRAQGPDWWLARAEDLGMRTQLEMMFLESRGTSR